MAKRYLLVEIAVGIEDAPKVADWREYHELRKRIRNESGVTQVVEIGPQILAVVSETGRTYASRKV